MINDKCPDCSSSLPDSALGMALLRDAESKTLHAPFSMTSGEQSDLHTTWHLKSALLSGDQCGVVCCNRVLDPMGENWEKRTTLLKMT